MELTFICFLRLSSKDQLESKLWEGTFTQESVWKCLLPYFLTQQQFTEHIYVLVTEV